MPNGHFWADYGQDYESLYDRGQNVNKNYQVNFSKKSSFKKNGEFWADCGPKLCELISQDPLQGISLDFAL